VTEGKRRQGELMYNVSDIKMGGQIKQVRTYLDKDRSHVGVQGK
jgi:hypothetical protein